MVSDPFSSDIAQFLQRALGVQLADPEIQLTEEALKTIARNAGLTEEDWENLCEKLKGHLAKGRNFLKFANFADAITELEHAAAIAPYRADVLVDCGKAHCGHWKETGSRSSLERAEAMFRKGLEIDPDSADAAEEISGLKQVNPPSRRPRKKALWVATLALVCGISAWLGITGLLSEKEERGGVNALIGPPSAVAAANPLAIQPVYPPATLPPIGERSPLAFDDDLVAHWAFDSDSPGEDLAPAPHPLATAGLVERTEGSDGRAMRFFPNQKSGMYTEPTTKFELLESITVSAWVKPTTRRGGQIVWFGDRRAGRDPWHLSLLGNGQVRFRTDRSVSSKPGHAVQVEEIMTHFDGTTSQHVTAESPGVLPLNEWSFLTGRIEKISPAETVITLFVNGTRVAMAQTNDAFDYGTDNMWIALGSVHQGETQNLDGTIDEVRIYRSALSNDEIREIYQLPRRNGTEK